MKSILAKAKSKVASFAAAGIVILVGCMIAGLGLTVLAFLALFALAAFGLALIAAPFVAMRRREAGDTELNMFTQRASAG